MVAAAATADIDSILARLLNIHGVEVRDTSGL